ncbi:MAG: hypothetical protein M3155_04945 [Actinomycetota bacterium]|nr:hypothetical protein [Actinomycetota bacterium]
MAEHPAPQPSAPRHAPPVHADPLACPECGSRLLQLLDAEPCPPGGWNALLECPECWAVADRHLADHVIEEFDRCFDDGIRTLVEELRRMTAEHMREEVQRFAAALHADAILPEDF